VYIFVILYKMGVFTSNGMIYRIDRMPAEMWCHYYLRAWWIVHQTPQTDSELNKLVNQSRIKFAEECLGCLYET